MRNTLIALLLVGFLQSATAQEKKDEKKIYTREEFKKEFYRKTEEEIIKVLGKADRISSRLYLESQMRVLEYDGIVRDKNAKEMDETTLVWMYSNESKDPVPRANRFTIGKKPR